MKSKPLTHDDSSGFEFAKEMLDGDQTAAVNFDRIQKHPKYGYIIFEYLLCDEKQKYVDPWTSHPNNYWHLNARKFLKLWEITKDLDALLYLVNYSKKGTNHENKVRLIRVHDLDETGIKSERVAEWNRSQFQKWFRKLNQECLEQ